MEKTTLLQVRVPGSTDITAQSIPNGMKYITNLRGGVILLPKKKV